MVFQKLAAGPGAVRPFCRAAVRKIVHIAICKHFEALARQLPEVYSLSRPLSFKDDQDLGATLAARPDRGDRLPEAVAELPAARTPSRGSPPGSSRCRIWGGDGAKILRPGPS
jgi:hypothetical protein